VVPKYRVGHCTPKIINTGGFLSAVGPVSNFYINLPAVCKLAETISEINREY